MEKIKPFEELTIQDNFLFERVMRNKRLCKKLIETILGIRVKEITYPSFEKAINIRLLSRGIRLDVYVEDDKGHIYNIEMQCSYEKELILARRARYYEALIDNENLEKGQSFAELNQTYVIFICNFDPFHKGKAKYTFSPCCNEVAGLQLKKGQQEIILNSTAANTAQDPSLAAFLRYVDGKAEGIRDEFTREVDREVTKVKRIDKVRREYMLLSDELKRFREAGLEEGRKEGLEEGRREGREEGNKEGRKEGRVEGHISVIETMIAEGFSDDQIIRATKCTPAELRACHERLRNKEE